MIHLTPRTRTRRCTTCTVALAVCAVIYLVVATSVVYMLVDTLMFLVQR